MANCILVPSSITAMNVDSYTRSVVSEGEGAVDIPNGTPLIMGTLSTNAKRKLVYDVTVASAPAKGVWMAYSPEVGVDVFGGLVFKNLVIDPTAFTNVKDVVFDAFYVNPNVDNIQITKEFFATELSPADVEGATMVEMNASGAFVAVASATEDYEGLQFEIVGERPILIGNGKLGSQSTQAWILRCVQN